MSEQGINIQTGVGRIVWGHPTQARNRKHQDGPNKGKNMTDEQGNPLMEYSFGVAFPKAEFAAEVWPAMAQEIATGYPNGAPQRFSYKYADGDTVDSNGKLYSEREGYAGCIVLAVTSRLPQPPSIFKFNGAAYDQLPGEAIKCGDFVSLGLNLKVHVATGTHTPSIYVNPMAIEFIGYGTEIVSTGNVDPTEVFKGRQHALPPGASATPVAATGRPGMPGAAPMTPAIPGTMPGAPPAPGMAVAAPPPPPPAPPPPPPPAGPQRPVDPTHIANAGTPHEQWWNGQAWTPAPALPPPAHDFVQAVTGMPGAVPMPGMPASR